MYSVEVQWWLHVQCGSSMVAACTVLKLNGGCMYSVVVEWWLYVQCGS
jgi:hypothetical protein